MTRLKVGDRIVVKGGAKWPGAKGTVDYLCDDGTPLIRVKDLSGFYRLAVVDRKHVRRLIKKKVVK